MKKIIFTMTEDHLTLQLENWKREQLEEGIAKAVISYVSDNPDFNVMKCPIDEKQIMIYAKKKYLYDLLMYCCADYDVELV